MFWAIVTLDPGCSSPYPEAKADSAKEAVNVAIADREQS